MTPIATSGYRKMLVTAAAIALAAGATTSCHGRTDGALAPHAVAGMPRIVHSRQILAGTWTDCPWPFAVIPGDLGCISEESDADPRRSPLPASPTG